MLFYRIPIADPDFEGQTRYRHSNGWYVKRMKRDWDARAYRGAAGNNIEANPMYSWEVAPTSNKNNPIKNFRTLREARAWCDDHRRDE